MNFETLTYEELKTAKVQIEVLMEQRRADALAEFKSKAEAMQIDLTSVMGAMNGKPKYTNDNGQTWSGRGRKPGWVLEAEAQGKTIEDLKM
jgi:DNA-binding protein H-NS